MAVLLKVGNRVINLDAVTDIELEAVAYGDGTAEADRVVRLHFVAPAIHLWGEDTLPASVTARTLDLAGIEADLLRRALAHEVFDVIKALGGPA